MHVLGHLLIKDSVQLVGEMTVEPAEIVQPDGSVVVQNSKVRIKKCRYLEHSGCTALCVNLCKVSAPLACTHCPLVSLLLTFTR